VIECPRGRLVAHEKDTRRLEKKQAGLLQEYLVDINQVFFFFITLKPRVE